MRFMATLLLLCASLVTGQSAVYDCFTFFNELDLLEVRLHELNDVVDHFVIVESVETFKGQPKPLYFAENRERFAKFDDKIIHVVLTERQDVADPWEREYFQRNQIMRGLTDCHDTDVVVISDADEIMRASAVPKVVSFLKESPFALCTFMQDLRRYFLNTYCEPTYPVYPPVWEGSGATTFGMLRQLSPQKIRDLRGQHYCMPQGGWHFTYLGGADRIKYKISSFSHQEYECWPGPAKTFEDLDKYPQFFRVTEIPNTFPQFILEHLDDFASKGFIYFSRYTEMSSKFGRDLR